MSHADEMTNISPNLSCKASQSSDISRKDDVPTPIIKVDNTIYDSSDEEEQGKKQDNEHTVKQSPTVENNNESIVQQTSTLEVDKGINNQNVIKEPPTLVSDDDDSSNLDDSLQDNQQKPDYMVTDDLNTTDLDDNDNTQNTETWVPTSRNSKGVVEVKKSDL